MANSTPEPDIPVLTDVVPDEPAAAVPAEGPGPGASLPTDVETLVAELQTSLAASTFALTEQLLHTTFAEMEASLFQQISLKLRQELPELIDSVLRQHLDAEDDED